MTPFPALRTAIAAMIVAALPAVAGEGHDHGGGATAPAGPGLPRFQALSETFELVGVLNGRQLTLYLDRAADNSPVKDAKVELELGGTRVPLKLHAEGEFEATLAEAPKPGVIAVSAVVTAGGETDLLAGELDLHDDASAGPATGPAWRTYGMVAAALAAVLAIATLAVRRRKGNRFGGVA